MDKIEELIEKSKKRIDKLDRSILEMERKIKPKYKNPYPHLGSAIIKINSLSFGYVAVILNKRAADIFLGKGPNHKISPAVKLDRLSLVGFSPGSGLFLATWDQNNNHIKRFEFTMDESGKTKWQEVE